MRDRPVRVLQVVGDGEAGGINSFLLALAGAIDRPRFEIEICNFGAEGAGLGDLREMGIKVLSMGEQTPLGPAAILHYFRLIRSGRYDIVHAHVGARIPRVAARFAGCRIVSHVHGDPEPREVRKPEARQSRRRAFDIAFGVGSDVIIACSGSVNRSLSQACPSLAPRVRTIRNGVVLTRWPPMDKAEMLRRRASAGLSAHALVVGFLGRLVPVKRIDCIVEAARQLLATDSRVQFVVLGEGPLRAQIARASAALGDRFRLMGAQPSAQWLPMLDALLLPSESEGLPYSVLEAMACAVPVIASAVGGIPEAVIDGETGILIPPGDPVALASAIDFLARHPDRRRNLGIAGRTRVADHFDAGIMALQFEKLYTELDRGGAKA